MGWDKIPHSSEQTVTKLHITMGLQSSAPPLLNPSCAPSHILLKWIGPNKRTQIHMHPRNPLHRYEIKEMIKEWHPSIIQKSPHNYVLRNKECNWQSCWLHCIALRTEFSEQSGNCISVERTLICLTNSRSMALMWVEWDSRPERKWEQASPGGDTPCGNE